jgi:hypothetical protein
MLDKNTEAILIRQRWNNEEPNKVNKTHQRIAISLAIILSM